MTLVLRTMRIKDVPRVVEIDRLAFSTPWSAQSYAYEVSESTYSHMVVLEAPVEIPIQGWKRIVRTISGQPTQTEILPSIVAYGGLWNIAGEAHISTIASHPDERGNGYGEVVLAGMIKKAINLNAEYIVLEVRISNRVAQKLYEKYEFTVEDVKRNYYRDNQEDAYDMRLNLEDTTLIQRLLTRFDDIQTKHAFTDQFTNNTHKKS